MVIDYQSHWYSRRYLESIVGRRAYPRAERTAEGGYVVALRPGGYTSPIARNYVELELQLADMEANGIDAAVKSANLIGDVDGMEPSAARETVELVNEEMARAQREHPDRIIGTAMLPMADAEAALATLDRAVGELGLRAVCMLSNVGGRPLGRAEDLPIFRRIEEHGLPVFLHPAHHSIASAGGILSIVEIGIGWMFDTSAAALSLVYGGVLDECPTLTVVHPHLGGALPYLVGRVELCEAWETLSIEHPLRHYLRSRFYVDSVGDTPAALPLAIDLYGLDRVLFATDYPWLGHEKGRRFVEDNLDGAEREAILHRNQLLVSALAPAAG